MVGFVMWLALLCELPWYMAGIAIWLALLYGWHCYMAGLAIWLVMLYGGYSYMIEFAKWLQLLNQVHFNVTVSRKLLATRDSLMSSWATIACRIIMPRR